VPAHLARRSAAGLPEAPNPIDEGADAHAKLRRRRAQTKEASASSGLNARPLWTVPLGAM
jgi:hypothetical protein